MTMLSGLFLASPTGASSRETVAELLAGEPDRFPMLVRRGPLFNSRLWEEYDLLTYESFSEDSVFDKGPPPYRHKIVFAFSGARTVMLAENKEISRHIFVDLFSHRIFPNFRRIAIFIDKLVYEFSKPESPYLITSLHGKYAGPERKLRTISLYGDDVTDSSIYRDNHALFNFHSCGVGKRLFDGLPKLSGSEDAEIARLSTSGGVTIDLRSLERAKELTSLLNYILRNRWVDEWVPTLEFDDDERPDKLAEPRLPD